MIDQEQIPPEAGSAAENEVAQMLYGNPFSELSGAKQDVCTNIARAAIAAAINAWPGSYMMEEQRAKTIQWCPWRIKEWKYRFLHLPLPQENSDG